LGTLLYKHVSQVKYKKIKTKQKRFVASVTCLWEKTNSFLAVYTLKKNTEIFFTV